MRLFTLGADETSSGTMWDPKVVRLHADTTQRAPGGSATTASGTPLTPNPSFNSETMGWMFAPGKLMTQNSISSLGFKDWFGRADEKGGLKPMENYCTSRTDYLCMLRLMGNSSQWAAVATLVNTFLQTPEGQEALKAAGGGLTNVDPGALESAYNWAKGQLGL